MMSADRNIDQGDSSRSATVVDLSALLSPGIAFASAGADDGTLADGAGAAGAAGAVNDGAGAGGGVTADGCDDTGACCGTVTGFCCASDGDASDSIASANVKPQVTRKEEVFIVRSSRDKDGDRYRPI
jgi:hypothetical protein